MIIASSFQPWIKRTILQWVPKQCVHSLYKFMLSFDRTRRWLGRDAANCRQNWLQIKYKNAPTHLWKKKRPAYPRNVLFLPSKRNTFWWNNVIILKCCVVLHMTNVIFNKEYIFINPIQQHFGFYFIVKIYLWIINDNTYWSSRYIHFISVIHNFQSLLCGDIRVIAPSTSESIVRKVGK